VPLVRSNAWWFTMNDDDADGLVQYNHPYSSGLDDSPLWDYGMPVESPDLNTYLCVQMGSLALIAEALGMQAEADMWRRRAAALVRRMIEDFWDHEAGVFRALHDNRPIPVLTPFNLYPLWSGQLPHDIRQRVLGHLTNPAEFWGEFVLPSVARNDPHYDPETMWRGPVWVNINYFFIEALEQIGETELARTLRDKTLELIMGQPGIHEYYNGETGEPPQTPPPSSAGPRPCSSTWQSWQAWESGYVEVNRQFATAIAAEVIACDAPSLVMLQDYHLYLTPSFLREQLDESSKCTLTHFIHIPWPGPEDWGMLPSKMRRAILEGLCSVDLLGFQTREDGLNFIRTIESHLPTAEVTFKYGRIWYNNHACYVRDFPISIDVDALRRLAETEEVERHRQLLESRFGDYKLIVRVDRTEPSKNIVRGFQAFDELLELYPQHRGKVQFMALLVPSRMEVEEYTSYLDELMAAAGRVNVRHGDSDWEPVRVLVGEDYARAIAALQIYDVLLVNSVADGMNLVAKEGPIVNRRDGILVLSERTGARQQLETGALVISPWDIYATAEVFHQALSMPQVERSERAHRLQHIIEREDIEDWLCRQLESLQELDL
jgi:trehalose 6-phosphate synthase